MSKIELTSKEIRMLLKGLQSFNTNSIKLDFEKNILRLKLKQQLIGEATR